MSDENEFEPRIGRMRSGGGKRLRRYLSGVIAAANLAGTGAASRRASRGYTLSRYGRGAGVGRMLASRVAASRRAVVKTSIVKLAGRGLGASAAHLRYLQRDGTTRQGEPGSLYDRTSDAADAKQFRTRGEGDKRQFRFIVSPEDGDRYDDLKALTRRFMDRVEEDLGTTLDWVAVDHFNKGHPHTHIVVRGMDDRGNDLLIANDYLTSGLRERVVELVELDLGPPSAREVGDRLRREMDEERLTSIDRSLLRDAVTLRVSAAHPVAQQQTIRSGRLAKLARMGLAEPLGDGHFRLEEGLEDTLRRMGERGDIVRTMQRAISEAGIERSITDQVIYQPAQQLGQKVTGRVVARGLADESTDRHYLIVDAIDGRSHYIDIGKGADTDTIPTGAIVSVQPRFGQVRSVDRTVAQIADRHLGMYSVDTHLAHDQSASDDFVTAHVRRLEAARRAGIGVERFSTGEWAIPSDYLDRVEAWERRQLASRPVTLEVVSFRPVDQLVSAGAATWLDRRLLEPGEQDVRAAGFGAEVERAQLSRRQWLIDQGLAEETAQGTRYRPALLAMLQRRELFRVAEEISGDLELPFSEAAVGERIDGIFRRRLDLTSGRFAVIERAHDFTLVPWRPTLERAEGKVVGGTMQERGITWSIGRGRGGPTIA